MDKDSDETVITLLDNAELTETLTVTEDVVLDLNRFAVSSTIFPMVHIKSGDCILRNGSILLTSDGSGTTSAPAVAITVASGAGLQASNATVTVTDAANSTVIGISTAAGSTLVLTETDVTVTTGKSLNNAGVHTMGTAVLTNCSVIAEADYTGANNAYTSSSKGIVAEDDLELYNCYVWGAHSGVSTLGNLYVDGGTYEGYGHGAFYIGGEGSTNHIYNATIRWATMRAGTVADSVAGTNHSAMYIGIASNITTYFDGCTFSANRSSNKSYCIVLRNSAGESNNCVYVSNSSFKNYNKYAYRSNDVPVERRLFAYSGVGNTYATNKVFQYARNGFYTNESYAPVATTKTPSVRPSATVNIGDTVSYTLTVTNNSNREKVITVSDTLPTNTTYVSGGDAINGQEILWNEISIPAQEQVELSYTVQVNSDPSLHCDGMLSAEAATVNGKSISSYPIYIRRTFTESDAAYLNQAILALSDSSYTSHTLLNWIYQVSFSKSSSITAGPIPTLDAIFTQIDDANAKLRSTVAPTLYGGSAVPYDVDAYFTGTRATQISMEDFIPGDVLVCDNNGTGRMFLFVDCFVELTYGMATADTSSVLELANNAERYAVIRPSIDYPALPISKGLVDPSSLDAPKKALWVTATNYLLRGERIQYDDSRLSSIGKAEFRWMKGAVTPENYTADQWGYTNCAAFCYDLYLYGIGQDIGSYTTSGLISKTNWREYYYQPTGTVNDEEEITQIDKFLSTLQVGDLIVIRRDTDKNGTDDSGHVMFYIGNNKAIHSTGNSYDYATSVETYEPSVRYLDIFDYLFVPESLNYVFGSTVSKLAIIRPLKSFNGSIPADSQNRSNKLSNIRVEKLSSCKPSVSVNPGDEITFSFHILNANSDARTVTITDIVPENTEFVSVSGGSESNGRLTFNITVGARQTATVSFTVRVVEGSYSDDAKVSSNSATANGVPLACPAVRIGNTLTNDNQAAITEAIAYYAENPTEGLSGIALVNAIYERAGLAAPFGEGEAFIDVAAGVVEKYSVSGSNKSLRLAPNGIYKYLLIDGLYGGRYLYTAELAFLSGGNRTRLAREHNLVVGDILLAKSSTSERVYIYNGTNICDLTSETIQKQDPAVRLERVMAYQHFFVILRPSFGFSK